MSSNASSCRPPVEAELASGWVPGSVVVWAAAFVAGGAVGMAIAGVSFLPAGFALAGSLVGFLTVLRHGAGAGRLRRLRLPRTGQWELAAEKGTWLPAELRAAWLLGAVGGVFEWRLLSGKRTVVAVLWRRDFHGDSWRRVRREVQRSRRG